MRRQPRLPRDRWPRLVEAIRLCWTMTTDQAEHVIYSHQAGAWATEGRVTPAAAIRKAVEQYRRGVLAPQRERPPRLRRERFEAAPGKQKVLWTGARKCAAGQGGLFDA